MKREKIQNLLPYGYINRKILNNRTITKATIIEPEIYNIYGEKKRTFYLKDKVCMHSPYTFSSQNNGETRYINWDRFNIGLPIHFYSHSDIFTDIYNCKKKFAFLFESEQIIPKTYNKVLSNNEYMSYFNGIFTHSERILDMYSNAYFIPGSSVWYGGTAGGGVMEDTLYLKKTKNISLVSSNKAQCDLHKYRLQLAEWFYKSKEIDVLGTFYGGDFISISDSLQDYRYSFAIENNVTSCYFTEKILNCFAAMTVPIYIGAKDIHKYFNPDGIICLNPYSEQNVIDNIIKQCNEKDYLSRKDAIIDNYNRVKKYMCIEDYIYENYSGLFD